MSSSKKNSKSSSNSKSKSKATSHQNLTDVVVESNGIFSFSPSQSKFGIINPNSASPILRIYSTQVNDSNSSSSSIKSANLISSYLIPSGTKPTSLNWFNLNSSPFQPVPNKKRRKSQSQAQSDGKDSTSIGSQELVLLSLSTSSILVYSTESSTVRFVLKDSTNSNSSSSSTTNHVNSNSTHIFSTSNGVVRVWNISSLLGEQKNHQKAIEPNFTFIPDSNTKVISSSPYPNPTNDNGDSNIPILSAHHSILLHSIGQDGSSSSSEQPLVKFTGHATDITHLLWLPSKLNHSNDGGKSNLRFLSASKGDRILTIWSTEVDLSSSKKKPLNGNAKYTISLDSDVKDIHVDFQNQDVNGDGESLLNIVTKSGQSLLYLIPSISSSSSSSGSTSAPQALKPTTVLTILPSQKAKVEEALPITATAILQGGKKDVKVKIVRSPKGLEGDAGIVADEVSILSANSSSYPPTLSIVRSPLTSSLQPTSSTSSGLPSTQRYTDPSSISGNTSGSAGVGTGEVELGALLGGIPKTNGDSRLEDVEIDMDEPTLAHRLGEMKVKKSSSGNQDSSSDSSDSETEDNDKMAPQSSATLTSTLLQALHTSDSSLLSSILTKGSPQLIRPTILRLPSSAALPLLEACLQRLARGGNQSRSRGSLGTREAKAIVTWIRETLLIHMASLMSIPGLIPRLANLYGTLNKRLENREKLQALEGRLGLVVGQIQVRKGYEEFNRKNKSKRNKNRDDGEEKVWREESDDEEEDEDEMDIDSENQAKGRSNGFGNVEAADDFGEIEEIDMSYAGGKKSKSKKSQEEESDDEEDDDDEDDDDEEDSENEVIQRRRKPSKKTKGDQMDLDDQSGDDEEEEEEEDGQTDDDSDDDEIDEEDESLLDEDEDDIEDSEEDSDDGEGNKGGPKGTFDMEAEESDGEEESEAEESE